MFLGGNLLPLPQLKRRQGCIVQEAQRCSAHGQASPEGLVERPGAFVAGLHDISEIVPFPDNKLLGPSAHGLGAWLFDPGRQSPTPLTDPSLGRLGRLGRECRGIEKGPCAMLDVMIRRRMPVNGSHESPGLSDRNRYTRQGFEI
ncbi:hypothetical protein B0T13DRAFT_502326 [Neurospora crassa]|nr:hypothetical protein B0T13DRAFT_502326 [Neurospora crassa]